MAKPVYVLNGPNLNMLGQREPAIYGAQTLADVERSTRDRASRLGLMVDFRQSNHEGVLVEWIQEARDKAAGIVINAGAYTHTSIALQDALAAAELPVIELHLSNVFRREGFRHHSYISAVAKGVICGFGAKGYEIALEAMADIIDKQSRTP
jgi:3-dehydroquinate dehydratase-2